MNILHTIVSFQTGGAEKLIIDTVNNWDESDSVNICIINNYYESTMFKRISNQRCKLFKLERNPSSKGIVFLLKYISIIFKNKIEIIHCHDKYSLYLAVIVKIIKPHIRIFHTIHDKKIYINLSTFQVFLDKIFTEKIIAISDSVFQEIIYRGVNKSKVELIYNGIDFDVFNNVKNITNKDYTIGCVARIQPYKKGHDILIESMASIVQDFPNVKCLCAGTYMKEDADYFESLQNRISELNLKSNIKFLGNVENIPEFLAGIDLLVLPSRYEGFGLVLVEGMAAKIPVIAANIDGPNEIIQSNKYGDLFNVGDYCDFADKIKNRILNPDIKKVEKAYNYAYNNFNIKILINKLKFLYNM